MKRLLSAVAVLALLLVAAIVSADVVERGKLLEWAGDDVKRVRVLGGPELYVSSETDRPPNDVLTTILFALIATVGACAAFVLHRVGRPRATWCFGLLAAGAAWLALDELLAAHETIGHNLPFLRALPGVDRPDDVVLAFYAVPAAAFAWSFRRELTADRRALALIALGVVASAGAVGLDVLGAGGDYEDVAEVGATGLLLLGFGGAAAASVGRALPQA